jgi:hypothetical protein
MPVRNRAFVCGRSRHLNKNAPHLCTGGGRFRLIDGVRSAIPPSWATFPSRLGRIVGGVGGASRGDGVN